MKDPCHVSSLTSGVQGNCNKSVLLLVAEYWRFIVPHRDTRFSEGNLKTSTLIGTRVHVLDLGAKPFRY